MLLEDMETVRITVANLKGGTGKTTTAFHLAAGLSRRGERVLLVDADSQGSALSWSETAGEELTFTVVGLPVKDIHRRVKEEFAGSYEHTVIDTPPGEPAVVRSALLAADEVIFPISPALLDIDRIRPTLELIAEVEPLSEFRVWALLTRVRRGTRSAKAARETIEGELGFRTFAGEIPLLEAYATSFGLAVDGGSDYDEVLGELLRQREVL